MKKSSSFSGLLGLTQEELALLLEVDRSRLAKYQQGSRDIPVAAKQLLAEMVQHISSLATDEKTIIHPTEQLAQKLQAVQKMLKENEYQQMATARKITSIEAKYTAKIKALQLVEFLSRNTPTPESEKRALLRAIARKANKSLKTEGLDVLFKLKLQLEMLVLEKLLLDNEIRKMKRALEITDDKV
jgi:transcriptional regulator with XRE-family HTH domain